MANYSWMKNEDDDEVIALLGLGFFALKPALIAWIWNWIAVSLFSAPTIGYWQAFSLNVLFCLLTN